MSQIREAVLGKWKEILGFSKTLTVNKKVLLSIGLAFAFIASIISFAVGLISGIGFLTILFRMFISSLLFLLFGIGVVLLLKYFTPEIYALILSIKSPYDNNLDKDNTDNNNMDKDIGTNIDYTLEYDEEDASKLDMDNNDDKEKANEEIMEDGIEIGMGEKSSRTKGDVLGNLKNYNIPDEPGLLAEAVKTMFNKDS